MALQRNPSSSSKIHNSTTTEFEILRTSHKFLHEDSSEDKRLSWNEKLAKKYYENLYREFAVCDLKHYKSGNFALRWRTESEVLSGAGESTCGNIRCRHHDPSSDHPEFKTLELPFGYEEHGEQKSALVKVVLCPRCVKKLMWKRMREKEKLILSDMHAGQDLSREAPQDSGQTEKESVRRSRVVDGSEGDKDRIRSKGLESGEVEHKRRRSSRSRSPRHNKSRRRQRTRSQST